MQGAFYLLKGDIMNEDSKIVVKIDGDNSGLKNLKKLEPVHIKIASKIIANVRFPKYITSSLS